MSVGGVGVIFIVLELIAGDLRPEPFRETLEHGCLRQ